MPEFAFYTSIVFGILPILIYTRLLLKVAITWKKMPDFISEKAIHTTTISVLIPVRNEENNILNCLQHIGLQNYPGKLFEIIIVDDHSTDQTIPFIKKFISENKQINIQLTYLTSEKGKKAALTAGIARSTATLIITLDGDCSMGPAWLSCLAALYEQQQPKMIIGPIAMQDVRSALDYLQDQEFMCLLAFTGSYSQNERAILCNGANLAYERTAFEEVKGFGGNNHIASGDDIFLLNKFQLAWPSQIRFLKSREYIVYTKPQKELSTFIQQRIRWASKAGANKNPFSRSVGLIVASGNIVVFFSLLMSFFYGKFTIVFSGLFMIKLIADYQLLYSVSKFFDKRMKWVQILLTTIFYPFYVVFILFLSMRGKYEWKGRRIN
jgi:biofilm PGA synthesis N-glycosyltransferase PgaC